MENKAINEGLKLAEECVSIEELLLHDVWDYLNDSNENEILLSVREQCELIDIFKNTHLTSKSN